MRDEEDRLARVRLGNVLYHPFHTLLQRFLRLKAAPGVSIRSKLRHVTRFKSNPCTIAICDAAARPAGPRGGRIAGQQGLQSCRAVVQSRRLAFASSVQGLGIHWSAGTQAFRPSPARVCAWHAPCFEKNHETTEKKKKVQDDEEEMSVGKAYTRSYCRCLECRFELKVLYDMLAPLTRAIPIFTNCLREGWVDTQLGDA